MPVKLGAKLPNDNAEARIEIIPLIDIMFFLLASFMLVSLSMVNAKSIKVNLPTAVAADSSERKNIADVSVDRAGSLYLDTKPIGSNELVSSLEASAKANPLLSVLISGDRDAVYGNVIHLLDLVRTAGVDKVAFEIRPPAGENASGSVTP